MNEIILAEFLDGESIFERIRGLTHFPFFDQYSPDDLDALLIYHYGERIVFDKAINLSLDMLSSQIVNTFSDDWNNLIKLSSLNILDGKTKTINEDTTKTTLNTGSNDNTHKVSAFNSDELINDYSDVQSNTNTYDDTGNRVLKETNTSLNDAFNNLLLAQKVNIINQVVKNVASYITLDIY